MNIEELSKVIARSLEFESELFQFFQQAAFVESSKTTAMLPLFNIGIEHAAALKALIQQRLFTSAMAIARLQYDVIVRLIWVLYAASDSELSKLVAPLTIESEQQANNALPGTAEMLSQLEKSGQHAVHRLLKECKDYSSKSLNSFVHGGVHAVNRQKDGYPIILLIQVIRQSNNLSHMAAIGLGYHLGNNKTVNEIAAMHTKYADCLLLK